MHVASGWLTSILLALFVIASGWFTEILLVLFLLCYNQWVVPDIDTAHRVPQRNNAGNPKPIVCRFVRRLVKESLMSHRKEISDVTPAAVGLPEGSSLSSARIYDHLSPRMQAVLFQAKKVKGELHYRGGSRIFLGGGALVSRSTSTTINHIVFFGRIPVALFPTQLYAVY